MKKHRFSILLALLLTIGTVSCGKEYAKPAQDAGAGRYGIPEQTENNNPPSSGISESENANNPDGSHNPSTQTELSWDFKNGKYVYTFPERDDSGLSRISEMESFSRAMFEDQPNDWFFGKTTRNEATGEVTYVWDRYQSTIDTLKEYGAIYRGDETQKVVYLTFDNGYENGTTAQILDILKEKNVPATFFVNGHYVESAPHLIRRMLEEGHIIGNHCVNHYDLTEVSAETFVKELQGLEDIYYATFPDAPPMIYFRPPSGNSNEWVLKLADMMGYTTVMWSWAYGDYDTNNQPSVETALQKVKDGLHNGCVYLLHPESTTNAAMLGEMIDWIRSQGYEFLPLPAIETN